MNKSEISYPIENCFNTIWTEVIENRDYDHPDFFGPNPFSGRFLVDIGANIGLVSKMAIERGATGVLAVEPDHINISSLEINCPQADIIKAALTDDCSPILYAKGSIRSTLNPITDHDEMIHVSPVSVDQIINRIPLGSRLYLKCDSEGAEDTLLRDKSFPKLCSQTDYIGIEWHEAFSSMYEQQVLSILRENGFTLEVSRKFWYQSSHDRNWKINQIKARRSELNAI